MSGSNKQLKVTFMGPVDPDNETWLAIKYALSDHDGILLPTIDIGNGTMTVAWLAFPDEDSTMDALQDLMDIDGVKEVLLTNGR